MPRLLAMTARTGVIPAREEQARRRLANVPSVRVVALHAIHLPLRHRMMMRQPKLRLRLDMTRETCRRILARIHDGPPASAAQFDMPAAWTVTRFTARLPGEPQIVLVKPRMRTRRKRPRNVRVAIRATAVPDEMRPGHRRRRSDRPLDRRARHQRQPRHGAEHNDEHGQMAVERIHRRSPRPPASPAPRRAPRRRPDADTLPSSGDVKAGNTRGSVSEPNRNSSPALGSGAAQVASRSCWRGAARGR